MNSTDLDATPRQHSWKQRGFAFPGTCQSTKMLNCVVTGTEEFTLSLSICSWDMMAAHAPPVTDLSLQRPTRDVDV
jgi:hypothetical protein